MSSAAVRSQVKQFLIDNAPSETVIDLTAAYEELHELLGEAGIQPDAPWLGLQFVGSNEEPVSLPATNSQGLYRETGTIHVHVVAAAALGVGNGLLTRGEVLRNLFRGRRIGNIEILTVQPMNTDSGTTLEFESGYMSGTFAMSYRYDFSL